MRLIRTVFFLSVALLGFLSAKAEKPARLIGFMETNSAWLDSADPTAAYGFYSFLSDGSTGFTPVSPTGPDKTWANCASAYIDRKYYCYDLYGSWTNYTITYRVLDSETWDVLDTKSFNFKYSQSTSEESLKAKNVPCGLAYDPVKDELWAVTHAFSNTESVKLCKVDRQTGELNPVADLPAIRTASCDAQGNIWGVGIDGNLYSVEKDGTYRIVGPTGYWPTRDSELKTGAAIDFRNGKMYWSLFGFASPTDRDYNRNGVCGLLEIDLATAQSKMTFAYPTGQRFSALVVPNAHPSAPDDIEGLSFLPESAGSEAGILSFTVPSLTYGQSPLTGNVGVSVALDGEFAVESEARAGTEFRHRFESLSPGIHQVSVTLSSNGHKGTAASASFYFGKDTPTAVGDLNLSYDKATGSAMLVWETPSGVNGGMLDMDNLRYKIERLPDNVVVARSAKGNSFTEAASFPWNSYSYRVTPYVGSLDNAGKSARSNKVKMGVPRSLPYDEGFDAASSLNAFTLIDVAGDGNGSGWDSPEWLYDEQYRCAFYYGKRDVVADDWLITPSLEMDESSVYKLTFKYYAYYGYGSKFRVAVGSAPEVSCMDKQILYKETVSSFSDYPGITETVIFCPRKGDSFIGFHHISETMEHLSIDDIHLERYSSAGIPTAVENLSAVKSGDDDVVLSFTLPTLNAGGGSLEGTVSAKVFKDDYTEPCATFTGKKPGEKIVWTDEKVAMTMHSYKVVTFNGEGEGFSAEVSVDLRRGTPVAVSAVNASLVNGGQVLIEWNPSTAAVDENGSPVDLDNMRYLVYKPMPDEEGYVMYKVIGRDLEECRFIDNDPKAGLGEGQQSVVYYVAPVNGDDEGYATMSNRLVVGESLDLPYSESWAGQTMANGTWFRSAPYGATWYIRFKGYDPMTDSFDGSGVASCETDRDKTFGSGAILSPCLDLTTSDSPELTFYMYQSPEYQNGVQLAVGMDWGDGRQHLIPGAVFNARSEEAGWKEIKVSLADYTDHNAVSVAFYGYVVPDNTIHIDNVSIKGARHAKELSIASVAGPSECRTGVAATFDVEVENAGTSASGDFSIDMSVGGSSEATEKVSSMQPGEKRMVKMAYAADEALAGKMLDLTFSIKADAGSDTNVANNSVSSKLDVRKSNAFRVSAITGQYDGKQTELRWNMPDEAEFPETFVDDVENYDAFAIAGVGAWTMHDGDERHNYLMSDGQGGTFEWPNCKEKQAFIVFDTSRFGSTMGFAPTSGTQYFAAWPAAGGANDDWLISPELPGNAQLISFYARSISESTDAVNVLVSYEGTDVSSFIRINGMRPVNVGPEWNLYHFALPEGARHFAIQYVGKDGSGIMIDDILYFGNPVSAPEGYNVYRDGVRINESLVKERVFSDSGVVAGKEYRYSVASVYGGVESRKSEELLVKTSGVDTVDYGNNVRVIGVSGAVVVSGAEGEEVTVYSADGRRMASVEASGSQRIVLARGIYVVTVGGRNFKVIVK